MEVRAGAFRERSWYGTWCSWVRGALARVLWGISFVWLLLRKRLRRFLQLLLRALWVLLRVQSIDEGSDVCPCRTLGRRHFFLYVKRVAKETKQTECCHWVMERENKSGDTIQEWERSRANRDRRDKVFWEKISLSTRLVMPKKFKAYWKRDTKSDHIHTENYTELSRKKTNEGQENNKWRSKGQWDAQKKTTRTIAKTFRVYLKLRRIHQIKKKECPKRKGMLRTEETKGMQRKSKGRYANRTRKAKKIKDKQKSRDVKDQGITLNWEYQGIR